MITWEWIKEYAKSSILQKHRHYAIERQNKYPRSIAEYAIINV